MADINPYQATSTRGAESKAPATAIRWAAVALNMMTIAVQIYFVFVLAPKYFRLYDELGAEFPTPTMLLFSIPNLAWLVILGLLVALVVCIETFVAEDRGKTAIQLVIGLMLLGMVFLTFVALRMPYVQIGAELP